jgi:L1 cell adhesion molecule like protein
MDNEDLALGIDLGTTFCCMGAYKEGKGVEIIPNKMNETTIPSIVTFTEDGILAGDQTVNHLVKESKNTVYGVKRIIGLNYNDNSVKNDISLWPFEVKKSDDNNSPMIQIKRNNQIKKYYPEEISAFILKRLKAIAEDYLERTVKYAVITVPAYFNDGQKAATRKAGELAGFTVLRIINEPTAAALGYGLDKKYGKLKKTNIVNTFIKLDEKTKDDDYYTVTDIDEYEEKHILVFDLGGGTFDVSLVNVTKNAKFEVKSTSGDTHLGGEDFDNRLVKYCLQQFCSKNGFSEDEVKKNVKSMKRLKIACEKSKRLLSISTEIPVTVDNFYDDETLYIKITRAKFEDLCRDLFLKLTNPIDKVINDAKIGISDIKEIVMVGGSTRIPKIKEILTEFFEGVNVKINDSINPDEAVAYGAAVDAYKIHSKKKAVLNDIVLLDTTPFSLGLGVGDYYQIIIPKGSTIPTTVTNLGVTDFDYQYNVELPIYEGEYSNLSKNHFLGKFEIPDIPKKPAGEVIFDVTYQVDIDGILTVSAVMKDDPSKKNWKVIKNDNVGLSENELKNRNVIQTYDPNKDVEEFKEDNNLKKRMKKLHELYEKEVQFNKKLKYLKNFCKVMSDFIDTFDSYKMDNDTVFEKYYIYLQGLFESYNVYFSALNTENKEDKDFQKEALKKISNYFSKISILDSYYIKNLIDKLKQLNPEMFQEIVIYVMGIMTKKGTDILNTKVKWSKYKAKIIFNDTINISSTYLNEDDLNLLEDITLVDKWTDYMKQCRESIQRINASSKAKIGDDRDNYNLYVKKENEDEEHIELVLDNFRDALQELENDDQKFDLELEAICLANIAKIKYKYIKHDNKIPILKEIAHLSSESIRRAMNLVNIIHKNIETTNWYKEIKQIDTEIQEYLLIEEEKSSGGFQLQIKKNNKQIFDELEEQFKNGNLEIIKFILQKYPPKDYVINPNRTIDEQWENNKKSLVQELCNQYALDNYEKETDEEKLKYTIMSVISSKVNSIYNEVK